MQPRSLEWVKSTQNLLTGESRPSWVNRRIDTISQLLQLTCGFVFNSAFIKSLFARFSSSHATLRDPAVGVCSWLSTIMNAKQPLSLSRVHGLAFSVWDVHYIMMYELGPTLGPHWQPVFETILPAYPVNESNESYSHGYKPKGSVGAENDGVTSL